MSQSPAKKNTTTAKGKRERQKTYGVEEMERYVAYLNSTHGNVSIALKKSGLPGGRAGLVSLRQTHPWFDEAVQQIMDQFLDEAESFVYKKSRTAFSAAKFLLTHHPGARDRGWGKRLEVTGAKGKPLSFASIVERSERRDAGGRED